MNQLGLDPPQSARTPADSPARALASVVDSVTALARAELKLAAVETRAWLTRACLGLGLLCLALVLLQVFALTLALTPILLVDKPWPNVVAMLLVAATPATIISVLAARELKKLKEPLNASDAERPDRH